MFDSSTEPSLFFGDDGLGDRLMASFERVGARFTFGGDAAKDQRVYFVNTKELMGNKYGTATPVPFRVVDANIGLDTDISVRCNGEYSYRIVDPLMFYKNVCSNVEDSYSRDQIDSQLKRNFTRKAFLRVGHGQLRLWGNVERLAPVQGASRSFFCNRRLDWHVPGVFLCCGEGRYGSQRG